MMESRDGLMIRGQPVPHSTLTRLWVCGTCGGRLKTIYADGWQTVCSQDAGHDPQKFVHRDSYLYVQARQQQQAMIAQDVLAHLPAELQDEIRNEQRREPCPSKD